MPKLSASIGDFVSKKNKGIREYHPKPSQIFDLLQDETVLDDDYPIYPDYIYIVDGVFTRCDYFDMTIREWKLRDNIKEIRRCNIFGHPGARLGDKVKLPVPSDNM